MRAWKWNFKYSIYFIGAVFTPSETRFMVPWDDSELDAKEGNDRLRWNLVFNILLLTVIPLPIWLPFASMELAVNILPIIQMLLMSCWLLVTFSAWVTYIKLLRARNKVFQPRKTYEHLVVISTYKEPLSLLISTIESIELQESCRENVNLTLSFEDQGYKPMNFSKLILIFIHSYFQKYIARNNSILILLLDQKQILSIHEFNLYPF